MRTEEDIRSHGVRTPGDVPALSPHVHLFRFAKGRRLRWYAGAGAVTLLVLCGVGLLLALMFGPGDSSFNRFAALAP